MLSECPDSHERFWPLSLVQVAPSERRVPTSRKRVDLRFAISATRDLAFTDTDLKSERVPKLNQPLGCHCFRDVRLLCDLS
jgi:hypothetical protein